MYWAAAYSLPHIDPIVQKIAYLPVLNGSDFEESKDRQRQQGKIVIPAGFDRLDELIFIDEDDHSNDVGSMIVIFREEVLTDGGVPKPIFSFLLDRDAEVVANEATSTVELSGPSLCSTLDWISVKPFDYPAYPSKEPNWTYGGENLLANPSFEEFNESGRVIRLTFRGATGGSFTLTFDGETTDPIGYDPDDISQVVADIRDELITLSNVVDVSVQTETAGDDPPEGERNILVEFIDPSGNIPPITRNASGLVGGTLSLTVVEAGGTLEVAGWTTSQSFENAANFARYDSSGGFEIDDERVLDGDFSILVNPLTLFGGPQQILDIVPGRRYWAYGHFNPSTTDDYFRIAIRDVNEILLAHSDPFEQNGAINTWHQMLVSEFRTEVSRIAFRAAAVRAVNNNPLPFWMDHFFLGEGEPPATVGKIVLDQLNAANTRAVGSFLNPTFTALLDSNGNAWDDEISVILATNDKLGQVMEQIIGMFGYTYDVVYNRDDGTIDFHIYNPGTAGTTHTHRPGILTGADYLTGGELVKRPPAATHLFGMTDGGFWNNEDDGTLAIAWGAREEGVDLDGLVTPQEINRVMLEYQSQIRAYMTGGQFTLNDIGAVVPYRDMNVLDRVPVNIGSKLVLRTREVVSIKTFLADGGRATHNVTVSSEVFGSLGLVGQAEAVRQLWLKLNRSRKGDRINAGIMPGGASREYVILAANDSAPGADVADVIGANNAALERALDIAEKRGVNHIKIGGRIVLNADGVASDDHRFNIAGVTFTGLNPKLSDNDPMIVVGGGASSINSFVMQASNCEFQNIGFAADTKRLGDFQFCNFWHCLFLIDCNLLAPLPDFLFKFSGTTRLDTPYIIDLVVPEANSVPAFEVTGVFEMSNPHFVRPT